MPEWTLRMSPEEYLKRYPEGPNAAEAREAIAAAEDPEEVPDEPSEELADVDAVASETRQTKGEILMAVITDDGEQFRLTFYRLGDDLVADEAESFTVDNYATACSTAFREFHKEARDAGAF